MSHSKKRQHGKSYYLDAVNPEARKFVLVCQVCGQLGYDPRIDNNEITEIIKNAHLKHEITRMYEPLALNELGHCETCTQHTQR